MQHLLEPVGGKIELKAHAGQGQHQFVDGRIRVVVFVHLRFSAMGKRYCRSS